MRKSQGTIGGWFFKVFLFKNIFKNIFYFLKIIFNIKISKII